jgi:hypothetical protein
MQKYLKILKLFILINLNQNQIPVMSGIQHI